MVYNKKEGMYITIKDKKGKLFQACIRSLLQCVANIPQLRQTGLTFSLSAVQEIPDEEDIIRFNA